MYGMVGEGPQWRTFEGGVAGIYVAPGEQLDVTYQNDLVGEFSTVHAHGQKGLPPAMDGVPDISAPPISPQGGRQRVRYEPSAGTFFVHSHWGMQHELGLASTLTGACSTSSGWPRARAGVHSHWGMQHELGLAAPLVVADDPPAGYPLADELRRARDVVVWLEDWCPHNDELGSWRDGASEFDFDTCMAPGEGSDVAYRNVLLLRLRVVNGAGFNAYRALHGALRFAPRAQCAAVAARPTQQVAPPAAAGWMDFWEAGLSAWTPLAPRPADRHVQLNLTGDNGFMSFNKHSFRLRPMTPQLRPADNVNRIDLRHGERVCLRLTNYNADAHPIHLHGHFFQLVEVNGRAINGPVRDTFHAATAPTSMRLLSCPRGAAARSPAARACIGMVLAGRAHTGAHCRTVDGRTVNSLNDVQLLMDGLSSVALLFRPAADQRQGRRSWPRMRDARCGFSNAPSTAAVGAVEELVDESAVDQVDESAVDQVDESAVDQVDESAVDQVDESAVDQVDESAVDQVDESAVDQVDESAVDQVDESAVDQVDESAVADDDEHDNGYDSRRAPADEAEAREQLAAAYRIAFRLGP
eukprot:gene22922-46942_t